MKLLKFDSITREWTLLFDYISMYRYAVKQYSEFIGFDYHTLSYDIINDKYFIYSANYLLVIDLNLDQESKAKLYKNPIIDTGIYPKSVVINGILHIIGGHDSHEHITFDPKNEKFVEIHAFPHLVTGISGPGLIHVRSKNILLSFGGYDAEQDETLLDIIRLYSITDNKWNDLSLKMPILGSHFPIFMTPNERYIVMSLFCDNEQRLFYLDLDVDDLNYMQFKEIEHIKTPEGYLRHAIMSGDTM